MTDSTVRVTPLADKPVIVVTCDHRVDKRDLSAAFRAITALLDAAAGPQYLIFDLQAAPDLPLAETFRGALTGPYRHRMLAEWIFAGNSMLARSIADTLVETTQRNIIQWCGTVDEALAYTDALTGR